jgi:monoamine oxidase
LNRRDFLRSSLSAAALATFPGALRALPVGAPKKVVVVGAGLAGLIAGYELAQAGHDVTILEASMRPGGRIYTVRDPFPDHLYAEGGAIDFGAAYTGLLHYIRLFNIPLLELPSRKEVLFFRGKRIVLDGSTKPDWPGALSPDERQLGRDGLFEKYLGSAIREIGHGGARGWLESGLQKYDHTTLQAYLRNCGLSEDAIALVSLTINGQDFDHLSALQSLALESFYRSYTVAMTMKGGNDQLPNAFAQALTSKLQYGNIVVKITQNANKVRVSFLKSGVQNEMEADRVICAIPFSVLRHMEMDSSLSLGKREAIEKLKYEPVMRVYLQLRTRFWNQRGEEGTASTDSAIEQVVDHTSSQAGTRGILEAQMEAEAGKRAHAMSPEQRITWAAEKMEKVHPGVLANLEGGTSITWDDDTPFARGAWATYAPGDISRFFPYVAKPEGRIHFAGEHTSWLATTLEGAVESGRRAAAEVSLAG